MWFHAVSREKSVVVENARNQTFAEIRRGERLAETHRLHLSGTGRELATGTNCGTLFSCPDSVDSLAVKEYERGSAFRCMREVTINLS